MFARSAAISRPIVNSPARNSIPNAPSARGIAKNKVEVITFLALAPQRDVNAEINALDAIRGVRADTRLRVVILGFEKNLRGGF